ncbi:MAG TPA: hypothetical protein VFC67_13705 [Prolixibacteraceae bacterium]|nr:hypothetical protein [Prolixibacteraceae bacterium]
MKKTFLFLLVFSFSFIICFSQPKNINESFQIKKELNDSIVRLKKQISGLENKLSVSDSVSENNFKVLSQSLDSAKKSIDDTRLRESLKSAESIINKQNSLIDGFGSIFTFLTILMGILAIGIPILTLNLNKNIKREVKESIKEAQKIQKDIISDHNNLKDRIDTQILNLSKEKETFFDGIKNELTNKFEEFLHNNKKQQIEQALINLSVDENEFKNPAISLLNHTAISYFEEEHLFKIYKIIKRTNLDLDKKIILIKILSEIISEFSNEFFLSLPQDQTHNNKEIRHFAYIYFAKENISKYEKVCTQLLLSSEDPTAEYKNLIDWYTSIYNNVAILEILNWPILNKSKKIKQKEIVKKLKAMQLYTKNKEVIDKSILFNELAL